MTSLTENPEETLRPKLFQKKSQFFFPKLVSLSEILSQDGLAPIGNQPANILKDFIALSHHSPINFSNHLTK